MGSSPAASALLHQRSIDILRLTSMALPAHRHKKAVSVLIALVRLGLCMHDA